MAIEFLYTGIVTPDMIRKAQKPTEPIPYRMDSELYAAMKRCNGGRTGPAEFMAEAVKTYVTDLDSVLLAAMDCKARQREHDTKSSMILVDAEIGDMLTQAAVFLKDKGFVRMGRGTVMVACALLKADSEHLIPAAEKKEAMPLSELGLVDEEPVKLPPKPKVDPLSIPQKKRGRPAGSKSKTVHPKPILKKKVVHKGR